MKARFTWFSLVFVLMVTTLTVWGMTHIREEKHCDPQKDTTWSVQLNELNYLVLKASSINLVRGMHFNQDQAGRLLVLSQMMKELMDAPPEAGEKCSGDVLAIRNVYRELTVRLASGDSLDESFKQQLYDLRKKEADLVKLSLLGAQRSGYSGKGCLKCHCEPSRFPTGTAAEKDPVAVTPKVRRDTDLAHVEGLLGKTATEKLWEIKDQVWLIVNYGQQCVAGDFRCCLLPAGALAEDDRIGQAANASDWGTYLDDIRKLSNKDWDIYKPQYLDPVREIVQSTLPGIKSAEVEKRIAKVEYIINTARGLGKMDYEIQKDDFCKSLQKAISIDDLNGESFRTDDDRKFIAAMYLLYYGSDQIYQQMLHQ